MNLDTKPTLWERVVFAATGDFPASWYRRDALREAEESETLREWMAGAVERGQWTRALSRSGLAEWRAAIERRQRP